MVLTAGSRLRMIRSWLPITMRSRPAASIGRLLEPVKGSEPGALVVTPPGGADALPVAELTGVAEPAGAGALEEAAR